MRYPKHLTGILLVTLTAVSTSLAQTTQPAMRRTPSAGAATVPAVPKLATLPDGFAERIQEVLDKRRDLRIDLAKVRSDAFRRYRENVPNLAVFASPETRQAISKEVSQAVREMVQIDIALTLTGSMGESRDTTLYGAIFSARENSMFNTMLLQACGDTDAVSKAVSYYGFPAEAVTLAAEFLTSDEKGQQQLVEKMCNRLEKKDAADIAAMEAAMLVLRREVLIDPRQNDSLLEKLKATPLTPGVTLAVTRYEAQVKAKSSTGQLGQPIELKGKLVDGSDFSTASLIGNVVVIDFWATWCGPCVAELPRVKALRKQYQDRGLEVVSISNDYSRKQLVTFLEKAGDMNWPQLFDEQAATEKKWHPITMGFGINAIPALYVIDRKGVLRHVDARKDLETIVSKLLDEQ